MNRSISEPQTRTMRLATTLVRSSSIIWILVGFVTIVLGWYAVGIRFDFSPQTIFATRDQLVQFSEQHKQTFGYKDAAVVVILVATDGRDALTSQALTWQADTADELEQLPQVLEVQALPRLKLPRLRFSFGDGLHLTTVPLVDSLPVDQDDVQQARSLLDQTQLLDRALVSPNRNAVAIIAHVDQQLRDIEDMDKAVNDISAIVEGNPPPPGYRYYVSGLPAVRVDIVRNLKANQLKFLPGVGAIFLIAFAILFRRVLPTVMPLLAVGIGLVWTIGLIAMFGQSFNLVSNVLPSLMLVVGTSNCVHIVVRYGQYSAQLPEDRSSAAINTMAHMLPCCLLTFLTTAAGFISILAAQADVLRAFAWQSALGMILLYISVMLTLGPSLSFMKLPLDTAPDGQSGNLSSKTVRSIHWFVDRWPGVTLLCGTGVVMASLILARQISYDSFLMETYDADHPTAQSLQILEDNLSGALPLEINLQADDPRRFRSPEVYRSIAQLQQVAEGFDFVLMTRSYVDIYQELYAKFRRREEFRDELPTLDEEGQRRIDRSFNLADRLSESGNNNEFLTADGTQARIVIQLRDVGTQRTQALIDVLEWQAQASFPPESGVTARLTSDAYLAAQALGGISRDLYSSLLTATLIIFGIIAITFRSFRLAAIAAVANLTPLAVTLGYMGLRGYDMTTGSIVVFAVSLGIAVDDTIHFLARFREEWLTDYNLRQAIQRTFVGTGKAILLTTFLIISGLAVLLTSEFIPTRRFAELVCLTMLGALLGDLLILPSALLLFWRGNATPQLASENPAASTTSPSTEAVHNNATDPA